ncbi:hypothetical protein NDU88_001580 [Pleurodeles waltl]|uniref:Uncharacterized protein n=1 Tax=Pleurodeles waltl TaxID=8319 RepID=A0AAV7R7I7_PLEWA|nr:hypothetical protein NDU88_001580 [Pleurodeles waltl]
MAPGTRRPIPTLGKMSGKQPTGISREAKSNAPPSSSPGVNKTQPMITGFWKGGAQEDNLVHITASQANMKATPSGKLGPDSEGKTLPEDVSKEKDFLLNWLQAPEVLDAPEIVVPKRGKDSSRSSKDTEIYTLSKGNAQLGFKEQETYAPPQAGQEATSPLKGSAGNLTQMAQALSTGLKVIRAKEKGPEWPKDGGDTFYSLTEDSDSTNSDQGLSECRDSISSESASFLSLAESTVRQQQWKSKGRAPSGDGVEPSAQTQKALKWDYSHTNLMSTAEVHTFEVQDNAEKRGDALVCSLVSNTGARYTDSEMLQSIYDPIKELQTETRAESRRAWMAAKHLQGTVRKVVKSCAEIERKLSSMEERTMEVEADIEVLRAQTATHDGQLTDIMWKLEDQENRQRRNNLRFLGIKEKVEGNNIRAYMIKMLQDAFPELANWDWESEVQRVHRYPVVTARGLQRRG